jgi:hypothetical protein
MEAVASALREVIVKYIFIGKQKVVSCLKLRENQREAAANAHMWLASLLSHLLVTRKQKISR